MIYKILVITFCFSFVSLNTFSDKDLQIEKTEIDSLKYYQQQKLKQEIKNLKSENSIHPIIRIVPGYGGIITAVVAILGVFISYKRYLKEKRKEIEQKTQENQIRLEAKFDSIIKNLGSMSHSLQASAAVSLITFLKPEYKEFHHQVYLILLANLKSNLPENVNALMVKAFEKALHLNIETFRSDKTNNTYNLELNLSRTNLYGIDLHGLNLENVDLGFSNLRNANLEGCILIRARGYKAQLSGARLSRAIITEGRFNYANFENCKFHGTNLVSAKLENTNLKGAEFQQAELQDAHLDDAQIYGAKFAHSNLNNTYLRMIKCGESDLKNMLKSKDKSWQKANFDKENKKKIKLLSLN